MRCFVALAAFALLAPARQDGAGCGEIAPADLARIEKHFASAEYPLAEKFLVELTTKEPKNGVAWNLLGNARHAQKHLADAAEAFERALALCPKEASIRNNLGVCWFGLQDYERARELFQRSASEQPGDSRAHLFLARIAAAREEHDTAVREFAAATAGPQPDPAAFFYQGLYSFQERKLEDAQRAFERALALDEGFASAHLNLALVLQRRGDAAAAEQHMRRFRALTELEVGEERRRMRIQALVKDAQREIEEGNLDAALASALAASKDGPEFPAVHTLLGRVYQLKGRTAEAERAFERARTLSGSTK